LVCIAANGWVLHGDVDRHSSTQSVEDDAHLLGGVGETADTGRGVPGAA
jgi:hypothetical protein